jgi:hypothetical protein
MRGWLARFRGIGGKAWEMSTFRGMGGKSGGVAKLVGRPLAMVALLGTNPDIPHKS